MARRFLYIVAGLIMFALAGALGWGLFKEQLMRAAFTPSVAFQAPKNGRPDYASAGPWLSRPDLPDDPSRWTPAGFAAARNPQVAVFYVSPTTYLSRLAWNAPLDDAGANERARLFAASQASAFNGVGAIWAPHYRQATVGAFLSSTADTQAALDFAYRDVLRAFDAFLAQIPASRPILLVGHSQGSLHLLRILHDRVAGTPLAKRIVAAYVVGWPISIEADLPALGLPACTAPGETGCILAWQSFGEASDAFSDRTDFHQVRALFDATPGLTGAPRRGTHILCVNPITGARDTTAPASANRGSLIPNLSFDGGVLVPGRVGARCDASGFLMIGTPPSGYGRFVLPGQNYHVFDYALFWANVRADAEARVKTYLANRAAGRAG